MFRHVALFRWHEGVSAAQKEAVGTALGGLPALIPELRAYHFGADIGLAAGNSDFAVVADFDDEAGWRVYSDHPAHQQIIVDIVRPITAERAAVQYEF